MSSLVCHKKNLNIMYKCWNIIKFHLKTSYKVTISLLAFLQFVAVPKEMYTQYKIIRILYKRNTKSQKRSVEFPYT